MLHLELLQVYHLLLDSQKQSGETTVVCNFAFVLFHYERKVCTLQKNTGKRDLSMLCNSYPQPIQGKWLNLYLLSSFFFFFGKWVLKKK